MGHRWKKYKALFLLFSERRFHQLNKLSSEREKSVHSFCGFFEVAQIVLGINAKFRRNL